jgi:2'-5' RNA ligase
MTLADPLHDGASVRAFVALVLDAPTRQAIDAAVTGMRHALGDDADAIRWGSTDALHVTVRFLGDVAPPTLAALRDAIRERVRDHAPVAVRLAGAGTFPPRGAPRVVWIGVEADAALARLHAAVEDACASVGMTREGRPYRPHLTVGRPRAGRAARGLPEALARVGFVAATQVASLHLMRSDLSAAGARHTALDVVPLVGGGAPGREAR